jgi:hypothetical protein
VGVLAVRLAIPAAVEVIPFPRSALSGGGLGLVTVTGVWPAVTLAGPAVALAVLILVRARAQAGDAATRRGSLEPFFQLPLQGLGGRLWQALAGLRVPPEYESLFNPPAIAAAMTSGRPLLWIAVAAVVTVLILR